MSVLFFLLSIFTGFIVVRLAGANALRLCRHDVLRISLGSGLGLAIASVVVFIADAAFGGNATLVADTDIVLFIAALAAYLTFRRRDPCPFCVPAPEPAAWWLSAAAAPA